MNNTPAPSVVRRALRDVTDPLARRWLEKLLLQGERGASAGKGMKGKTRQLVGMK